MIKWVMPLGRMLSVLLLCGVTGCDPPVKTKETTPQVEDGLVWEEQFSDSVDPARWTFETGGGGWGNEELQYYRTENAAVKPIPGESGKALVLTAKKEAFGGSAYTSSRLKTQGKASWTYGTIEARMKLPRGQGIWPAFWMLGESISTVGWSKCGEIDIMEMIGGGVVNEKTTHGTLHWWNGGDVYSGGSKTLADNLSDGFHTFGVSWTESKITWSVDGAVYYTKEIIDPVYSAFHKPQFLLLNLAVGGRWPGTPDDTIFPQELWVDWIRVHQNK